MTVMELETVRLSPDAINEELNRLLGGRERRMKSALDLLFHQACRYRASDIHVEMYRGEVRIRFRVDGFFQDVAWLPADIQEQLICRVKVMAGLTVHRRDIVQEGRIRIAGTDFRVSIIPTVAGEKLAVRIFDTIGRVMELEDLGFSPEVLRGFQSLILDLSGTVLLTGPSGCGKTTTLYAALRRIHDREGDHAAITTIEDPVEFDHEIFAQMQVSGRSSLTFAKALTSVLRQDPRVIMVGEIRDPETCEIAIRAGLTGHLVLSTIHSRCACGVVDRLLDMGVEPYILSSSLRAVMAQRLARIVCPECTEPYEPADALAALVRGPLGEFDGPFLHGRGCSACLETGFQGRTALTELLPVDEYLSGYIADKVGTSRLEEAAREAGFVSLLDDGIQKVRAGRTTVEEVVRALGAEVLH